MPSHPLRPHEPGPGDDADRGEDSGGARTRVRALTRGWVAALAVTAVAAVYFAGPPRPDPARRVSLVRGAGPARAIGFGPGGAVLAATMGDGGIRPWRLDPGSDRAWPLAPPAPGLLAAFAPDGAALAVGDMSAVTLWDGPPNGPRRALRTDDGETCALAFRRDGGALAVAWERAVAVWELDPAGGPAATRIPLPGVLGLALAPDGLSLATGGRDGFVRVWDLATGRQRLSVRSHDCSVTALAFSDDGRALASASVCDPVARLWDAATGLGLAELRGHTKSVQAVAFAPGGRMLATAGAEQAVRVWDVASGRERATFRCRGVQPVALAFSPDGRKLAAGGFEPEVLVWDVSDMTGR